MCVCVCDSLCVCMRVRERERERERNLFAFLSVVKEILEVEKERENVEHLRLIKLIRK